MKDKCPTHGRSYEHCGCAVPMSSFANDGKIVMARSEAPPVAERPPEEVIAGLEQTIALLQRMIDDEKPVLEGVLAKLEQAQRESSLFNAATACRVIESVVAELTTYVRGMG